MTGPREPRAELRMGAANLHETFVALIEAGFSEYQALALLGQEMAARLQAQQPPPEQR